MTNYEHGYTAGLTGELPAHHEGLMLDPDYVEGYRDGQGDRSLTRR